MNAEVARLSVSLLYGVPSLVLYATVLVQLFRPKHKKHFDNPFFKLCFLIGVVECIGYLEFYLFFTLPTYSLFSKLYGSLLFSPSAFTTTIYFLNYFLGYLQLFGSCFLTFNRFTSVVFPLKHDKIWRFCFPLSIVATSSELRTMSTEIVPLIVSLLYGVPSMILYIVILLQIVRPKHKKRFGNPFFRLYFLIGVVDCLGYVNSYIFITLPTYSFFSSFYGSSVFAPSPLTTAIYFAAYLLGNLQLFGNCFLTFNQMWNPIILLLLTLLPIIDAEKDLYHRVDDANCEFYSSLEKRTRCLGHIEMTIAEDFCSLIARRGTAISKQIYAVSRCANKCMINEIKAYVEGEHEHYGHFDNIRCKYLENLSRRAFILCHRNCGLCSISQAHLFSEAPVNFEDVCLLNGGHAQHRAFNAPTY
ncbi:hypothetical protein QR680_008506 [Steinernema hermaphroditum]|uniref:Serpentine receptor class gamma n=1 Tax=Steinernema hermaphroditum TaxID=289476 RepID=A0AA39M801_9BILA|nr:hypothetical protein QR680_008506 [Steinernema hermaphroditum]